MTSGRVSKKSNTVKFNPKKFLRRVGFICFAIYIVATLISQQGTLNKNAALAKEYSAKIVSAEQERDQLKDELSEVGSDEYYERMAREKLGMIKSNERVFIDATRTN